MARWGQGYVAGGLPAATVGPIFDAARAAWKEEGREGSPKLVAVAYFALGDEDEGRRNIRHYYEANGSEYADTMAKAVNVGRSSLRSTIESFAAIGTDELIFLPGLQDPDEVSALADAVL
jgi:hypothetical protein